MPIYIFEEQVGDNRKIGSASKWWLHHSLDSLNNSLDNKLNFYCGDAKKILENLIAEFDIAGIFWNRCYEPLRIKKDREIKAFFKQKNIIAQSFNGSLLWEPHEVLKSDQTPYKVFTPYYRKGCLLKTAPRKPLPKAENFKIFHDENNKIKLDTALIRPVRIDITHELSNESHNTITEIYFHLFGKKINPKQLEKVKSDKTKILSLRIYMRNSDDYETMNSVFKKWMPFGYAPSRATICNVVFPNPKWQIEIVVIASK
jgi:deoxyribodipyrimidine photolyase